tara:strand:+ start:278 stop:718 length:441 start_codon:yes stop_codon:yes gene_type:complete
MKKFITMLELNNANADIEVLLRDTDFQEKLAIWDNAHKVKKNYLDSIKNLLLPFTRFIKSGVSMNKNHRDKLVKDYGITVATFQNGKNQKQKTQCFNVWQENHNSFNHVSLAGTREHKRVYKNNLKALPSRPLQIGVPLQDEVDIC